MIRFIMLLITVLSLKTFSQNQNMESFEGIIIYENNFQSKIDSISDEHFENAYGKQTKYIIAKNGDYINLYKGSYITIQLFKKIEDRVYTLLNNRDTIFYNMVTEKRGSISKLKTIRNSEEVLGKSCNELSFVTENSKYHYFYNDEYFIDSNLYSNHYLGSWDEIVKTTKSFPMKVILENKHFIMTSTAVSIKKGAVNKKLFTLPPNISISKSKENLFIK